MDFVELLKSSQLGQMLITFIVSLLPIIELRGAIPIGVAMGLSPVTAAVISVVGNMLPIPFIVIFIRRIFIWMQKKSARLARIAGKLESKALEKGSRLYKGELIGLMVFVAIPLPGTGAWTGALIAAILGIRLKAAFPAIAAGVVIAGILVLGITYGFTQVF
jgi:uncharacterized membrane protein